MKRVIIVLVSAALFVGCNPKDDNDDAITIADIIGSWTLTHEEGYEVYGDEREDWSRNAGWLSVYTFNSDNTGIHNYNDGHPGEWSFTWQYTASNQNLSVVSDGDPDRPHLYVIEILQPSLLVIIRHVTQGDYEYYQKSKYAKSN